MNPVPSKASTLKEPNTEEPKEQPYESIDPKLAQRIKEVLESAIRHRKNLFAIYPKLSINFFDYFLPKDASDKVEKNDSKRGQSDRYRGIFKAGGDPEVHQEMYHLLKTCFSDEKKPSEVKESGEEN